MMSRYEPASPYFRRELRRRLAILALVAVVLLLPDRVLFDSTDRTVLLAAFTVTTLVTLRTVRRGGPRDASDYLLGVWIGLAVAVMAVALAIAHLMGDRSWVAVIWGCTALVAAIATPWVARLALFVRRLPELLESGEESRAFVVGTTELDGRQKRVAVMVTDKRLIIAAPHRGRPRLVSQRTLARVDYVDVRATERLADIQLRADGATLAVRRVPLAQAHNLAAALGSKPG